MPLGFERLNERTQRPNAMINFIRTLPGPNSMIAEQILNRVAAICYPFMRANTILVQALEEFPYNKEFVGRNFNNGEVIQLVLRDRNGRWLPQRMVEMVMVHELAHCKQMNHSKAFWDVRDAYAADLRALWAKGYTGEGMWGRGRGLDHGNLRTSEFDIGDVPEHLCGGTYGRRSKKRRRGTKEKDTLTYAERKQRRILRKFGAGGQSLGADEDIKIKLEGGVPSKSKPRVAGSARGRGLRAAAALARLEPLKTETEETDIKDEEFSDSDTENEVDPTDATLDVDGSRLVDDNGRALIKICGDGDDNEGNARREMDEITLSSARSDDTKQTSTSSSTSARTNGSSSLQVVYLDEVWKRRPGQSANAAASKPTESASRLAIKSVMCRVCSLSNEPGSLVCAMCSNVLNPNVVSHWNCKSGSCRGSDYINADDAGACGACGQVRSAQ